LNTVSITLDPIALPREVIVAGWTGRDAASVRAHIEELAEIGIPPPSQTPLFYLVSPDRLTQRNVVTVVGSNTSGEAEPVLVWQPDGIRIGIGSDHTDRDSERYGVAISKQLCPKVVGRDFWLLSDVTRGWDQLLLRSFRESEGSTTLYQEGPLSSILHPDELIERYGRSGHGRLETGSVMFCGTVPTLGGIARADALTVELHDPATGSVLRHRYRVQELPVVA
jgi:hypothetical protein